MKTKIKRLVEIEITHILLQLPIRYDTEDMPADFPLRDGDDWTAKVNIDTGQIEDWPKGKAGNFNQKQNDTGTYTLIGPPDANGVTEIACIDEDYVPHGVVPGEYGDYVDLQINEDGIITNWPKRPDVSEFFKEEDE